MAAAVPTDLQAQKEEPEHRPQQFPGLASTLSSAPESADASSELLRGQSSDLFASDCSIATESGDASPQLRTSSSSSFTFQHIFSRENPGKVEDFFDVASTELGTGAFGSVSSARCRQTGSERAVKAVDRSKIRNPMRLEQEIRVQAQLNHPNVVRLFETFQDASRIYLVMELCTGGELFDRILSEAQHGFDEARAASYIQQIVAALCYIHSQDFAHRDLKPENCLLQNASREAKLKIIDFGLATRFEEGRPMRTQVGSPMYVAPEVLTGKYNERCDVWSAGVILYILLCGHPPFFDTRPGGILRKVKRGSFEFKSPEWDNISQTAKDLVSKMLTFDAKLRPGAERLLCNAWLKGPPQEAQPLSSNLVRRLKEFQANSKLKRVALTVVAQQLPDEQVTSLQSMFRILDKDMDGTLSAEEIREGMEKQGIKVPNALDDIFRSVDSDGSGRIDVVEFVAATIDERLYRDRAVCWAAFRVFDLNADGKITHAELTQVLAGPNMQSMLGAGKITQIIKEFDTNGDGCIDFEEFYSMMVSTSQTKESHVRDDAATVAPKPGIHQEIEAEASAAPGTKRKASAAEEPDRKKAKTWPDCVIL